MIGLLASAPCQLLFKAGLVEKLVSGKIAKQQYIDQVNALLRCEHQHETFVFWTFFNQSLSGERGFKEEGGDPG